MLRRKVLSLATALVSLLPGIAVAQDNTTPPPAPPPAAEPAAPVAAPAASADQGKNEKTEEIVVTGSRIRRKDLTTPAPVTVISKEQIQAGGQVSVADFLQALPEQGGALNQQVNNGNDGTVTVNLRGLGDKRTLVLVNGRRMVYGGTGQTMSAVDLNTIPAAAVERIEILKDGASAVYGSDAVAGVVNIILKRQYVGTEVTAYSGTSKYGDGSVFDLGAITGTGSDRGNILFSLGYQEGQSVIAGNRPWAETTFFIDPDTGARVASGNSSTFPSGRFSLPVVTDADGNVTGCRTPGGTPEQQAAYTALCNTAIAENNNIFVPQGGPNYAPYDFSLFNTNPTNYLITPNRRIQLFSAGDTNIGGIARGFFEASYVNRTSAQSLAPMPVVNNTIPTKPIIISKDSIYNPFGIDITSWRRRTVEFGDRRWSQDLDTFHVVGGLDGTLGEWAALLRGWNWDVSYNYGRTSGYEVNKNQLRMPNVGQATGPSTRDLNGNPVCLRTKTGDQAVDLAKSNVIPGCVPMDVLHGVGTLDAAAKDFVAFNGTSRGLIRQDIISANLSGDLFQLFTDRPLALAIGGDYRYESGTYQPDAITAALESSGNNVLPTSGKYNVAEGYAELSVPLMSGIPLAENVEASAALRVHDYSTFGSGSTYKFGARYSPFRDVTLRGTIGTAYRAPNVYELFGGATDSYPILRDPCRSPAGTVGDTSTLRGWCAANGVPGGASNDSSTQFLEKWESDKNLRPEKANIWTLGLVLEPRMIQNLSITVDYYNTRVFSAIDLTGAAFVFSKCYTERDASFCNLIERDPTTGQVILIHDPRNNKYNITTAGYDLALRYSIPTPSFGRFGLVFDATMLDTYQRKDTQTTNNPITYATGNYDLGFPLPRYKFNAGVSWGLGRFGAGVVARYIGHYKECNWDDTFLCHDNPDQARQVAAYLPFDLYATYALKSTAGKTSLAVGVRNVTNETPPYLADAFAANSDPSTYDYVGRFYYIRLTHGF